MTAHDFIVIAHRGASSYAPENTLAAFDLAIQMGVTHMDVHATSDSHILHAEGYVVRAWGVATEDLMRQVVKAGADGMTVNFPDKLIAYLRPS